MRRLAILGAGRLSEYFNGKMPVEFFEKYSGILTDSSMPIIVSDKAIEKVICADDQASKRMYKLYFECGENIFAQVGLELACLCFIEPEARKLIELICGASSEGITLETVATVVYGRGKYFPYMKEIEEAYKRLSRILVPDNKSASIADGPLRVPLRFDYRLAEWIEGIDTSYGEGEALSDINIYGYEEEFSRISKRLENKSISVLVKGQKESGRKNFARFIAQNANKRLYIIPFNDLLLANKKGELEARIKSDFRENILTDCYITVSDIKNVNETEEILKSLFKEVKGLNDTIVFFLMDTEVKCSSYIDIQYITYNIKRPDRAQTLSIWKGFLTGQDYAKAFDLDEITNKMRLYPGQIKRVCDTMRTDFEINNTNIETKDVYRFCYEVLDDGRYENVKRVVSGYTLDDLKISARNLSILKDICGQVIYSRKVYDTWDMDSKYQYGKCVSAIFAGPPGTGKTMAVNALSSELGLELYKVDLSQLVDKYIGETEKRLEDVFKRAEKSNMILFFDEADAIMGKRTETQDSHDKYANTEIAYILQRIEEYDGIVILATNYLQNIDTAFMRRIRYVINFELPDEATRMEIWKSSFAKEVPLSESIDFEYLAKDFKLSGGSIKNIVLNATFYAAEQDKPVDMAHILKAINRENQKDKRVTFVNDYGQYGYLVTD